MPKANDGDNAETIDTADNGQTAADIYAELQQQDDPGDSQAETPESESDEDDQDDSGETEPEDDSEADESDEPDLPELDQAIRDAIGDNAEALKAWERQWKGVQKKERQIAERTEKLGYEEEGYKTFQSYNEAFSKKETVVPALQRLAKSLSDHYGIEIQLGTGDNAPLESSEGFEFESDEKVYSKAKADAKAEIMKELGIEPGFLQSLKAEREQTAKQAEFDAYVAGATPRIAAKAEKQLGWKGVDKAMVAQAAREFPELIKSDPMAALKKAHPDAYAKAIVRPERARVAEMLDSSGVNGIVVPTDPFEYSAAHAYAETRDS